jgi:hypothetical protein
VVTRLPSAIQSQSQGSGDTASLVVPEAPVPAERWPAELGTPASVGSQNDLAYAVFPAARRLAIERAGHVTVYDTLDHQIGGVSQQQSRGQSLTLTSQHGLVRIDDLPVVSATTPERFAPALAATTSHGTERGPRLPPEAPAALIADGDIFAKIERLADLRQKNILTEAEFEAKKAELLSRL